jgi:hypothetical protein
VKNRDVGNRNNVGHIPGANLSVVATVKVTAKVAFGVRDVRSRALNE